jgi:hypothetical protein
MQWDFETNYSHLDIHILGINQSGREAGNDLIPGPFNEISIPWVQDVDINQDLVSDAWYEWQATYRDVIILDKENEPVGRFNLSTNSLSLWENYSTLRQMFVNVATQTGSDFDEDSDVDGADFLIWQTGFGQINNVTHERGDADGNALVNSVDLAIWQWQFGYSLLGLASADSIASRHSTSTLAVPEPTGYLLLLSIIPLLAYRSDCPYRKLDP